MNEALDANAVVSKTAVSWVKDEEKEEESEQKGRRKEEGSLSGRTVLPEAVQPCFRGQ